jgi:hypothetical protein
MSEALRLADESTNLADRRLESDGYEWSVDADVQLREAAAELRRLAPMEAEWAALSQDAGKAEGEIDRLRSELQRTREELAALLASLGEPRAFIRRWAFDGEKPAKEKNANGRLAWPKKYLFVEVSKHECAKDDVPLFAIKDPK